MRLLVLWPLLLLYGDTSDDQSSASTHSPKSILRLHLLHDNEPDLEEHFRQLRTLEVATSLACTYGNVQVSLSSFTDKPLPFLGYGNYGNYATSVSHTYTDYCFKLHAALTSNVAVARQELLNVNFTSTPSPLSQPAATFDALLRLLETLPSATAAGEAIDGGEVTDVIIVTTNTWSHDPGDALAGIERWNSDRHYAGPARLSWGGFGSDLFDGVNLHTSQDVDDWSTLAQSFRKADAEGSNPLISAELLNKFGPFPYPVVSSSHSGPCNDTEYPSLSTVRDQLQSHRRLFVIFALGPPQESETFKALCEPLGTSGLPCLSQIYRKYLDLLEVGGLVISMGSAETLSRTLTSAVLQVVGSATNTSNASAARDSRRRSTNRVALTASLAAASGALATSLISGLIIWQKCVDDETDMFIGDACGIMEEEDNECAPLSRADRAILMFRGLPVEDFSSVEPLDSTPRSNSSLPDQFF